MYQGTIYDLIPKEEIKVTKPPRYISRFRETAKRELKKDRVNHKTWGQAKIPPPHPARYLKKHSKEPLLPHREKFKYACDYDKRPPVPKVHEAPLMGVKSNKNYITFNAINNITSIPMKPPKKFADTRRGDTHDLVPSGLEAVYVHRKDFGVVPKYLLQREYEMRRAQEEYDRYVAEHFKKGTMRQLTKAEWQSIVDGMKSNWEDIHERYQRLSVITDTMPKKHRKERMEDQMKQLERDIEMFERHKVIYVANC